MKVALALLLLLAASAAMAQIPQYFTDPVGGSSPSGPMLITGGANIITGGTDLVIR